MYIYRYLKLILLFFVFFPCAQKKSFALDSTRTEVIIIGTVHYDTDNFNSDSLVNILNVINPGLILIESDTSYLTRDWELKEDIKNEFLETKAITKYKEMNEVNLRPYDIDLRDDFLNDYERMEKESSFFFTLDALYNEGRLSHETEDMLLSLITSIGNAELVSGSPLYEINKPGTDSLIREINYYTYEGIKEIISSTPDLLDYKTYWDENYEFWTNRNDTMVENITRYAEEFEGNRIIVLCGFSHKPYIADGLSKLQETGKITVKEYWEY